MSLLHVQSTRFFIAGISVSFLFILSPLSLIGSPDAFQPLSVILQPKGIQTSPPVWEKENVTIQADSDTILIPVPALASQDEIGGFALTVVFQDHGEGGPVVEWQPKGGDKTLLSAGIGESGIDLGLNARTLLINQSLALDGGTLRISYAGRFSRLISVTMRPARELSVASLGADFNPSLLGENETVLTADEVSGTDNTIAGGDRTDGQVIHAELSAAPRQLDAAGFEGGMEFIIPLGSKPQGSLLQTEIAGLDPESLIEVTVNGELIGSLAAAPFSLNSPSTLLSPSGRLQIAGWHPASLFIPARLWKEGDNSMVLRLNRVQSDEGAHVYLRKARVDLLFDPTSISPAPPPISKPITTPTVSDTLSTGSAYGNPSPSLFHTTPPATLPVNEGMTR